MNGKHLNRGVSPAQAFPLSAYAAAQPMGSRWGGSRCPTLQKTIPSLQTATPRLSWPASSRTSHPGPQDQVLGWRNSPAQPHPASDTHSHTLSTYSLLLAWLRDRGFLHMSHHCSLPSSEPAGAGGGLPAGPPFPNLHMCSSSVPLSPMAGGLTSILQVLSFLSLERAE